MDRLVFNKNIIEQNIIQFKKKCGDLTRLKLLFPIKACTNSEVLNIFFNEGFGFDVSNNNELSIVSRFKCFKSFVGPKCNEIDMEMDDFVVYYDNISDYLKSNICDEKKGIRINFNSSRRFGFSHFGVDLCTLNESVYGKIKNIHFHLGDNSFQKELKHVTTEIDKILTKFTNLKSLDIGGGYEDYDLDTLVAFLTTVHGKLKTGQELILECGDMWFKNSGKLFTKIISIKEIAKKVFIVYLSVSKDCNLKWSSPVYLNQTNCKLKNSFKYYFCGSSCYEKDIIGKTISNDRLNIGDTIEFANISHYSVEWNKSFNGIDAIEVCYE